MELITQRFIRADELTPEQTWELLTWCADHGGNEFSVRLLCFADEPASAHGRFRDDLANFQRSNVIRGRGTKPIEIWQCCRESIERLKGYFPKGLFAAPSYASEGWFEDVTVYRKGEIMLGIVNHEGMAVIRLVDREHKGLLERKIKSYETAT